MCVLFEKHLTHLSKRPALLSISDVWIYGLVMNFLMPKLPNIEAFIQSSYSFTNRFFFFRNSFSICLFHFPICSSSLLVLFNLFMKIAFKWNIYIFFFHYRTIVSFTVVWFVLKLPLWTALGAFAADPLTLPMGVLILRCDCMLWGHEELLLIICGHCRARGYSPVRHPARSAGGIRVSSSVPQSCDIRAFELIHEGNFFAKWNSLLPENSG